MKLATLNNRLVAIAATHKRPQLALSLGAEDMLLLHQIDRLGLPIDAFVLDTGRLHEQSYAFLAQVRELYQVRIAIYSPRHELLEDYYRNHGPNAFYHAVELRKQCCHIRKVEPLSRALAQADAWLTGQRRSQSITRAGLQAKEHDRQHAITKYNPLAELPSDTLWQWIAEQGVITHPLHQQGMPSIGCAPCTREVQPHEDERAGRWWWENATSKECGLHQ